MSLARRLICICIGFAAVASAAASQQKPEGNYKLSYIVGSNEITICIVKLESKDGKLTASTVAASPRMPKSKVENATVEGTTLKFNIEGTTPMTFEGTVGKKEILGSVANERFVYVGKLTPTEDTEIAAKDATSPIKLEALSKITALTARQLPLQLQYQKSKDNEEKTKLRQQILEATKKSQAELPALYQELVEKHADSPAVFAAFPTLVANPRTKATPEQIKAWAKTFNEAAKPYGLRFQADIAAKSAEALINRQGGAELALEYANLARQGLGDKPTAEAELRVVKLVAEALRKTGKADEAKAAEARVAKLDAILDEEYHAKVPPFKAEAFAGRKEKNDRVVVMELFTGAQCPPCVAADVAFDVLQKTYNPTDVVLLQYHMHIPGPDPLTNAETEARFAYYRKVFGQETIRGTPSTLFNGKPQAGGGGAMGAANNKYKQYRGIIEPLLEEAPGANLKVTANRQGDKIDIKVEVADLKDPGEPRMLRVALVEETIRYVGSNKLRFHHQVVRAFPGGVEGTVLKDKNSKHDLSVSLADVKKNLTKYLDDYVVNKGPFPYPDRPLDLKNLRVVAFVQDDKTCEILQATQVEIADK